MKLYYNARIEPKHLIAIPSPPIVNPIAILQLLDHQLQHQYKQFIPAAPLIFPIAFL